MWKRVWSDEDHIDPKRILERRYLYFALVALRARSLRAAAAAATAATSKNSDDTTATTKSESEWRLLAVDQLDEEGVAQFNNVQLRSEYQDAIQPQLQTIFETFLKVDQTLFPSVQDDGAPLKSVNVKFLKQVLQQEQVRTVNEIATLKEQLQQQEEARTVNEMIPPEEQQQNQELQSSMSIPEPPSNTPKITPRETSACDRLAFLNMKHDALMALLEYHNVPALAMYESTTSNNRENDSLDAFGMDMGWQKTKASESTAKTDDDKRKEENWNLIRQYQTLNLVRSALIREELGYSILCFKSTLGPDAGRGVFCDGQAQLGDLVAFQPGLVWPKEHLDSPDLKLSLEQDEDTNLMMSLRFDEYLIDARHSPGTVLTQRDGSFNPWALGHMVNHPNFPEQWPNCQSLQLNYPEQEFKEDWVQYIPNSYARNPTWRTTLMANSGGGGLPPVLMHGMCLLARKDLYNEELFVDYRLQTPHESNIPSWYKPVLYGDPWMDKEQLVHFRTDWLTGNDAKQNKTNDDKQTPE